MTIRFDQLRLSATLANVGLESYTDGTTGASSTRVAVDSGTMERSANGIRLSAGASGNGLDGGAGSALSVNPDTGISVSASGVAIDQSANLSTITGTWTWTGGGIDTTAAAISVATPTLDAHAATKAYVDSIAAGLDPKESVVTSTTQILDSEADISGAPAYDPTTGTNSKGQITATLLVSGVFAVDGKALADGDRLLIKNEESGTAEVNSITARADVAGDLNNDRFYFYTTFNLGYYVWFNVNAAGADPGAPSVAGKSFKDIEVALATGATATTVAAAVKTAIDATTIGPAVGGQPTVGLSGGSSEIITITNAQGGEVLIINADTSGFTSPTTGTPGTGLSAGANGIWIVTIVTTALTLNRAPDFDGTPANEVSGGAFTFIEEGTVNADSGWVQTNPGDIVVGTATGQTMIFTQFSGAGSINAGVGLTKSGSTINAGDGTTGNRSGLTFTADDITVALGSSGGLKLTTDQIFVEPADFAGTGLEDDGSDNMRLAAQGNGILGGAGSTLSVDPDSESAGNIQPVNVVANGVGLDINAIAGVGIEADGSANLRLAAQGNGIAGGAGSTLSVNGGTAGGNVVAATVTASGVGFDVGAIDGNGLLVNGSGVLNVDLGGSGGLKFTTGQLFVEPADFAGTGLEDDGADNLRIAAAAAGAGLAGGGGTALAVGAGTGITVNANDVAINTGSTVSFSGETWTYSVGGLNVGAGTFGEAFAGADVPNANWIQDQIRLGVAWRFPVLTVEQLDDTNDSVSQAAVVYFNTQPISGDNIVVALQAGTTRTYQFGAGGDVTVTIGGDADASMANLATAITGDGAGLWDAVRISLSSLNSSGANFVVVIYRANQSSDLFIDHVTGTWGTQANVRFIDYAGENDYTKVTNAELLTSQTVKNFGPGDAQPVPGQAHVVLNGDDHYVYDADGGLWVKISGTGSITAGAGLSKTVDTLNVGDAGKGIQVNADDLELDASEIRAAGSGLKVGASAWLLTVEPADFVGAGLEDDGADNMRIATAAAGNGLTGGGGAALSVQTNDTGVATLEVGASGVRIAASAAGTGLAGGGGAALSVNATAGVVISGDNVVADLEAAAAGAGGLTLDTNQIRILVDGITAPGGTVAAVMSLNANGLAVNVDDSSIEASAAGGDLRVKALGIATSMIGALQVTTAKLAADAVTVAKLGIRAKEESLDDTGWTVVSGSVYKRDLAEPPLIDTRIQLSHQMFVNGVADRTNNGTVDPTTGTYRFFDNAGTGQIRVFGNPASSSDKFLVRYWTANP